MPLLLPPHPPLTGYYGAQSRATFLRDLFDATSADYDRLEALLSFGTGLAWRRRALRHAAPAVGASVLDLATGTGSIAAAARRVVGPAGVVVALDVSAGMLRHAAARDGVLAVCGSVDALPIADACFDLLTMGYALRHVASLPSAFAEWARVLRPGGRLLLLEIGRPEGRVGLTLARIYLGRVLPALASCVGGNAAARLMRYYWDTIVACVPPATIVAALHDAGFADAACETQAGFLHSYRGTRRSVPSYSPR